MSLLDRKLLRDLRSIKSQALAVAVVMGCGLAMMIMTRSLIFSLESALTSYYEHYRFSEVFTGLKRAPLSVAERAALIPGISQLQPSLSAQVTLDLPGMAEPASAQINTLPEHTEAQLNKLCLRSGHFLTPGAHHEILVSESFAEAHALHPGDSLSALLNGRKILLHIAGIVLSPEYVFEAPPGAALPDNRAFGVFWMRYDALAEAFNMEGAFNRLSATLSPGADPRAVISALDRLFEPYGSLGAYAREKHPSHIRVRDEIRVLQGLSFGFPIIFLSVAAFMTNAVMARLIHLQREQIAILKAFGFGNRQIGAHFFKFTFAIIFTGTAIGLFGGIFLGHRLVEMYHLFFRFPQLDFHLSWPTVLGAVFASAFAASLGVVASVRRAVRLSPAEAMRPDAPASFRPSFVERLGAGHWFSPSLRMALRNLERKPWQALLTSVALALATGILIIPNALRDGIRHVLDSQWDVTLRETVSLRLVEPASLRAVADFRHLPGVITAEPFRSVPAEISAHGHSRRVGIFGTPADGTLARILGPDEKPIPIPPAGIVLSRKLAEVLGVSVGDEVVIRILVETRPTRRVIISALAEDFAGIASYMELDALNRVLHTGDRIDGARLSIAAGSWPLFLKTIKETPRAAGIIIKDSMRESFRKTTAQSIGLIQTIYLAFATIVAFGIVYNSANISLSERQRELATLRVLGFTRREVGTVLVGELSLLAAAAIPLGLLFGSFMAFGVFKSINTETVRLPLILSLANFTFAALVIITATTFSLLLACRKINRLDLVATLKARD